MKGQMFALEPETRSHLVNDDFSPIIGISGPPVSDGHFSASAPADLLGKVFGELAAFLPLGFLRDSSTTKDSLGLNDLHNLLPLRQSLGPRTQA
jgi:hypothetical protein